MYSSFTHCTRRCFRCLFYGSFRKAFHEIATCTLADWVVLLHENPEVIDEFCQLVGVREGGSFARARLQIEATINKTISAFVVVIASFAFVQKFYLFFPKLLKNSPKVFCPKVVSPKILNFNVSSSDYDGCSSP